MISVSDQTNQPDPIAAIDAISIQRAPTEDDVWAPLPAHAEGLHPEVSRRLAKSIVAVRDHSAPAASVVLGATGTGKTHLLTWTRQQVQAIGGYFFIVRVVSGVDFWASVVDRFVDDLYRTGDDGRTQVARLIDDLTKQVALDPDVRAGILGQREPTPTDLTAFVDALRKINEQVAMTATDTIRALVLVASSSHGQDVGRSVLELAEPEPDRYRAWSISTKQRTAHQLLRDLTRVIALAGPLVFAFDQLDSLLSASQRSIGSPSTPESPATRRRSDDIAAGLMELREDVRRTLIVVACQPDTWEKISRAALRSSLDRFDVLPALDAIPDAATATAIVSSRFQTAYTALGFSPPYPSWPIATSALVEAPHRYTARALLTRVEQHITECQRTRVAIELTSLRESDVSLGAGQRPAGLSPSAPSGRQPSPAGPTGLPPVRPAVADLAALTAQFQRLREDIDDLGPLDQDAEDRHMPDLLGAGLGSLVRELGVDETRVRVELRIGSQMSLHARLVYTVDDAHAEEIRWSFRAIAASNARAFQTRLRKAILEAGLETGLPTRSLIVLRNSLYPPGPKSAEITDEFRTRGGRSVPVTGADLRTFGALAHLLRERPAGLDAWLRQERPAARTELLRPLVPDLQRLAGDAGGPDATPPEVPEADSDNSDAGDDAARVESTDTTDGDADPIGSFDSPITIGWTVRRNQAFTVPLDDLCLHTLAIGASGSGKTVLLKRIIEECALRGVSAIVLDPNSDLAQLGNRRPETGTDNPTDDHSRRAERYFAETEVVVWTPGLSKGRPLAFQTIPDLGAARDDPDDYVRLLDATVAVLEMQAGIRGTSQLAQRQRGLLKRALDYLARDGGRTLEDLVDILAEPPSDVANSRTRNLAVQLADTLQDVLDQERRSGARGEIADPGMLLTPSPGKNARISVISFLGIPGDEGPTFVQRLQSALFTWFRAHPTRDRPLGGLLVMDEAQIFAPSKKANASTASTIDLARQVRKYGLGMIFASQQPRGISHEVVSNTANQLIGRLTSPAQLAAAEQMVNSRNSPVPDFGSFKRGIFYAAGEGTEYTRIRVATCLTKHSGPLNEEEIIRLARSSQ